MAAVAVVLFVFSFWLAWGLYAPGSVTVLLQSCAVALVVWFLFAYGGESGGLFMFVVKGFVVSFVLTSMLWLVVGISVLGYWFSYGFDFRIFLNVFEYIVLPTSLLPVALSVVAYGLSRNRLPAWLILLSSWYVLIYGVFAVFDVWWLVFVFPYLTRTPYVGGAGSIARAMLLVFLAFVVACVYTAVYVGLRKSKQSPPP